MYRYARNVEESLLFQGETASPTVCPDLTSPSFDLIQSNLCHFMRVFYSGYAPLFECHAACSCDLKCLLRATQPGGGRSIPRMKLGFISQKGWGAFSVDAIPRGTFVAEYTGEALTLEEARKRVCAYDRDGLNYVLITQEFFQGVRFSPLGDRALS